MFGGSSPNVEVRERTKFAGLDANRYVVTGKVNGIEFRFVNHVLVRDRFVFQVLGWGQKLRVSTSGRELAPFFDAFKVLPGEIKGRVPAPVTSAQGVGWHVKNGVFESVVTGLRCLGPQSSPRAQARDRLTETLH